MNTDTPNPLSEDVPSRDLIVRIDERTRSMAKTLDETSRTVSGLEARVTTVEIKLTEMGPVKLLVFGCVGIVLMTVVGAILALIFTRAN
jgi:hypothetical protein